MRRSALLVLLALLPAVARAAPLTEADARAFVARQSQAWNAGDLARYFALFAPGATFTDQGRAKDGRTALYGVSTLTEARAQAKRALRDGPVRETTTIRTVRVAPDGKSAEVTAAVVTVITKAGRPRRSCAERSQTLIATPSGLRSQGQTDTVVFCR